MSCSDSAIEQNGARPPYWRIVGELVAAAGEDLVRVGLVADVPEDLVARRVEQRVQRDGQLAGAEVGAEVAADLADRVDDVLAHLLRELRAARSSERPCRSCGRSMRSRSVGRAVGHEVRVCDEVGDLLELGGARRARRLRERGARRLRVRLGRQLARAARARTRSRMSACRAARRCRAACRVASSVPVTSRMSSTIWNSTPSSRGEAAEAARSQARRRRPRAGSTHSDATRRSAGRSSARAGGAGPSAPARRALGDVDVLAADHPVDAGRGGELARRRRARASGSPALVRRARGGTPRRRARRRRGSRRPRRTRRGRSAGRGAGRRRPSPAGRRGSASRCGSARSRPRAAARSPGRAPTRARRREREHRPDPLAARQQRVAHRLLEARRSSGSSEKRSAAEVALDLLAQVVGIAGAHRRAGPAARAHSSCPGRAAAPAASRARELLELGARPRAASAAQSSTSVGRGVGRELAGAQLLGGAARGASISSSRRSSRLGSSDAAHSRAPRAGRAPRMPLTKPGRLRAAEGLRGLDRLVDRALGRDRRARPGAASGCSISSSATRMIAALQRRDPLDRPALRRGGRSPRRAPRARSCAACASARVNSERVARQRRRRAGGR